MPWFARWFAPAPVTEASPATQADSANATATAALAGEPGERVAGQVLLDLLRLAGQEHAPVSLHLPALDRWVPTSLVGLSGDGRQLYIRPPADATLAAALTPGARFNVMLRSQGQPLLLGLEMDRTTGSGHQACYVAWLSDTAISAQARAWRRVCLPGSRRISLVQPLTGGKSLVCRVIDLSEGGFGIALPEGHTLPVSSGDQWASTRLETPSESIGPMALEVCNVRNENGQRQLGLRITRISGPEMQRLRRLLMQLQTFRARS